MKTIFLDRDGVIINNADHYYICKVEDIEFVDGIFENLKRLKNKGYEFFIVSNQGGIAKKEYTKDDVNKVHQYIQDEFKKHDIEFREIYFCPHHDTIEACLCRKPSPLMIEKLMARYDVNPKQSCLIGDNITDIQAAEAAGIAGIKIDANKNMLPFIQELIA
ncbi:MAG TPA: HAD-IIIA family hydrolase [Sunxiuqinia sp.]|nr:HAD-IIIA family hydrolase [Sunxiuqinia sp.]